MTGNRAVVTPFNTNVPSGAVPQRIRNRSGMDRRGHDDIGAVPQERALLHPAARDALVYAGLPREVHPALRRGECETSASMARANA